MHRACQAGSNSAFAPLLGADLAHVSTSERKISAAWVSGLAAALKRETIFTKGETTVSHKWQHGD